MTRRAGRLRQIPEGSGDPCSA